MDTQALYDRKMAERHDRGIGYPSCAAIAGAGCKSCSSCALLGKVKSPLNIRPTVTATANPAAGDAPQADPSFVDPYAEFVGPEFPLDILPPTLANFVDAEHHAMGADPAAIAMAALTAVAAAMHAETLVRVGDGWWERPIFWTFLLGHPSSMKSPIIEKATKPLSRIDHERDKRWRHEHAKWTQISNNKTIPSPPKAARCVLNDATPEKVAEVLSRDPSGSLMVHDELAGWLGRFERYNTGQSSRALYLSSWNGGPFLKDRVGKGKTDTDAEVRVDNLALSILGGIQPDRPPIRRKKGNKSVSRTRKEICQKVPCIYRNSAFDRRATPPDGCFWAEIPVSRIASSFQKPTTVSFCLTSLSPRIRNVRR